MILELKKQKGNRMNEQDIQEYKKKLNIPDNHKLVKTDWSSKKSKGRDIDYWKFEEFDTSDKLIARYSVTEDMNIYDQKTDFSFSREPV